MALILSMFFPMQIQGKHNRSRTSQSSENGRPERNRTVSFVCYVLVIHKLKLNYSIVIETFGEHFHRRILRDIDELCVGCIIGDNDDPLAAWPDCLGSSTEHICTGNTADALGSRHWHLLFDNCRDEGDQLLNKIFEKVCFKLFIDLVNIPLFYALFRPQPMTR